MQVPAQASSRFRVGEFEVDLRSGELRRGGDKIKLQGRPFQILAALLARPGEVVTREEIQQKLWPTDTFVDFEHSINTAVKKLREALGDDAESPRFIQTLPKYGYRLVAPVEILGPGGGGPKPGLSLVPPPHESPKEKTEPRRRWPVVAAVLVTLILVAGLAIMLVRWRRVSAPSRRAWVQITHFADSATSPAFSPDGHMIAFIRGPDTFLTPGQIYVKILPDGEPVQLTHDALPKMGPAFSPDGSRIAYTAVSNISWDTWVVPVLGGEPVELLPNASGLTWADRQHVMFSEAKKGYSFGVATSAESRAGERDVYRPADQLGMAHRSWLSPDGKWVLVSEMDLVGWQPCRLVPFDGSTRGETVGPKPARCTYAGWSPDGSAMYFSADAGDGYHLWRQRFPNGTPEQITFGPTEEEGIAISPDGRSLITCAGIRESTVWIHDARGDRQISGEGYATVPGVGFAGTRLHSVFSPDGKRLYYLVRKQGSRAFNSGELWIADLDSGRTEAVLPAVPMSEFDISEDGKRVAFAALDAEGNSHIWVAPLDRVTPPTRLTASVAREPGFGPEGSVYFLAREGDREFLYSVGPNESVPRKIDAEPSNEYEIISPHGEWLLRGSSPGPAEAKPKSGGPALRICSSCEAGWGHEGKVFYIRFRENGEMAGGKTIVMSLSAGSEIPHLPPNGVKPTDDLKGLNVLAEIGMTGKQIFAPGPDPSIYAYSRMTVQRNLFRIHLN